MRISDWSSDVCSSDHGGINCWTAPGGKPRCVFQDIYAISPSARDYMFRHHAVKAVYTGIEMNTLVDASILYDPAGGKHVLNDVRLEGGTFSASRSLFNHPNSAIIGSSVEIKTVSVASGARSEEHTSELQSLMRISYAVFCLKKKNTTTTK